MATAGGKAQPKADRQAYPGPAGARFLENLVYRKTIRPRGLRRVISHAMFLALDARQGRRCGAGDLRKMLPPVQGARPATTDGPCSLIAFGDPRFISRFAPALIASIRENSPTTSLHLHQFGEKTEALPSVVTGTKGVSFSWEASLCDGMSPARRCQYYQSMRFIRLAEFLQTARRGLLAIDIDSVVRRNLDACQHFWQNADIGLILRYDFADPGKRVLAAALYAAPTDAARRFMSKGAGRMLPHVLLSPFTEKLDQRCLQRTFQRDAEGVRIVPLPMTLAALDGEDAVIVSYRGKRKNQALQAQAHPKSNV